MWRCLLATLCALCFACTLVLDTSALDEGCPPTHKPCSGKCVPVSDPDFGCGSEACRPCVIPNATAHCGAAGSCIVATCRGDFLDCNGDGDQPNTDGCETDGAHDPQHCGGCNNTPACTVENGKAGCAAGRCAIALCDVGFRDCNHMTRDGCEIDVLTDPENCGKCGVSCATSAPRCVAGECQD